MLIAIVVVATVVALLAMPLDVEFDSRWPDATDNRVAIRWALGLVKVSVVPARRTALTDPGEASATAAPEQAVGESRGDAAGAIRALRMSGFRRRIWRFILDLWRSVHKRNVEITARIGLATPADTGRLWGLLGPLSALLRQASDVRLDLQPEFRRETVDVTARGHLRVYPIAWLWLLFGLLASPSAWRGVAAMRAV